MTVRYENIHLHAKVGQAASAQFRQWLDQNGIAYINLDYADPLDDLRALSTWYRDDNDDPIIFTNSPVLTYDRVVWEADDGSDKYVKSWYATESSDLPSDFTTLAEQVS
tara:strand:+ start:145 stop:471 length:327 start_codon:yes stop_codon:yes gene_type:complete